MRICLISPPTLTEFTEGQVAESEAIRLMSEHAPMGILSLAAVLEEKGCTPQIIDLNRLYYDYAMSGPRGDDDDGAFFSYAVRQLEPMSYDVFGFSSVCSSYPLTLRLASEVSRAHPDATIILGGPQASVVDVPTLKAFPFVDYVLRGEAEVTLPRLLDSLSGAADDFELIGGLTYRRGGVVRRNPNAPVIEDLDSMPLAALHLYPRIENCSYVPLEAGRGCPFACSFCSTNDFFRRRFRLKSPHVLVDQMRCVNRRYGINSFDLIHDMFTIDRKRVVSFCEAMEESGEHFDWSCSARTDCVDEELLDLMARSGCRGIFFGIDTGSDRMQTVINKGLDLQEARVRIANTDRHAMTTTVSLIAGFHEETKDDLRDTVGFFGDALRHRHTDVQFHLLAPLAETPITTRFKDQLIYDGIFSDMSFHGWEQDPQDRAMIIERPDIFPNFYAVPTPWLDRHYVKELREFLLHGETKHRLLMVLLHQDSGDLLRVFDEWQLWSAHACSEPDDGARNYYASRDFSEDLLRFARTHYSTAMARYPHLVMTIAEVENALLDLRGSTPPDGVQENSRKRRAGRGLFTLDSVPAMRGSARVVIVEADYKKLVNCLRRKGRLTRIPAERAIFVLLKKGDEIKVLKLNKITYQLLRLCDGAHSIKEIAEDLSSTEKIEDISMTKAILYGLTVLIRQGLIDIAPAGA